MGKASTAAVLRPHETACLTSAPHSLRGLVGVVIGQQLVQAAMGVAENALGCFDLVGRPGLAHLHGGGCHLTDEFAQSTATGMIGGDGLAVGAAMSSSSSSA